MQHHILLLVHSFTVQHSNGQVSTLTSVRAHAISSESPLCLGQCVFWEAEAAEICCHQFVFTKAYLIFCRLRFQKDTSTKAHVISC